MKEVCYFVVVVVVVVVAAVAFAVAASAVAVLLSIAADEAGCSVSFPWKTFYSSIVQIKTHTKQ